MCCVLVANTVHWVSSTKASSMSVCWITQVIVIKILKCNNAVFNITTLFFLRSAWISHKYCECLLCVLYNQHYDYHVNVMHTLFVGRVYNISCITYIIIIQCWCQLVNDHIYTYYTYILFNDWSVCQFVWFS